MRATDEGGLRRCETTATTVRRGWHGDGTGSGASGPRLGWRRTGRKGTLKPEPQSISTRAFRRDWCVHCNGVCARGGGVAGVVGEQWSERRTPAFPGIPQSHFIKSVCPSALREGRA